MDYKAYSDSLSAEEKEMFDEMVREEMEKLEKQFQAQE